MLTLRVGYDYQLQVRGSGGTVVPQWGPGTKPRQELTDVFRLKIKGQN